MTAAATAVASAVAQQLFRPVDRCWICGETALDSYHVCHFDLHEYAIQDPELDAYTGQTATLVRCRACGFGQPDKLPALPRFFDRMYDQRWSEAWIEQEFDSSYKDFIFNGILRELNRRMPARPRRLLDIGAHAGRFMRLAHERGWIVEGIELNPRTAMYAARRTNAPVHQINAHALVATGSRFHAVTMTDVLEHIPDPVALLTSVAQLVEPGGSIAVKVPCGRSQWHKERLLSAINPRHEVSLAGNLVHVNHFTPRSLAIALEGAGFTRVRIQAAAPELLAAAPQSIGRNASNAIRLAVYSAARLPGGVHSPLALNLQAYAERSS